MNTTMFPVWIQWALLIVAVGCAIYERLRNAKLNNASALALAKDELLKVLAADRDAQKSRYETEHGEYIAYREHNHALAAKSQLHILELTEANALLKAKTDITPIMVELKNHSEMLQQQGPINQAVLAGLQGIQNWCVSHEKICSGFVTTNKPQ